MPSRTARAGAGYHRLKYIQRLKESGEWSNREFTRTANQRNKRRSASDTSDSDASVTHRIKRSCVVSEHNLRSRIEQNRNRIFREPLHDTENEFHGEAVDDITLDDFIVDDAENIHAGLSDTESVEEHVNPITFSASEPAGRATQSSIAGDWWYRNVLVHDQSTADNEGALNLSDLGEGTDDELELVANELLGLDAEDGEDDSGADDVPAEYIASEHNGYVFNRDTDAEIHQPPPVEQQIDAIQQYQNELNSIHKLPSCACCTIYIFKKIHVFPVTVGHGKFNSTAFAYLLKTEFGVTNTVHDAEFDVDIEHTVYSRLHRPGVIQPVEWNSEQLPDQLQLCARCTDVLTHRYRWIADKCKRDPGWSPGYPILPHHVEWPSENLAAKAEQLAQLRARRSQQRNTFGSVSTAPNSEQQPVPIPDAEKYDSQWMRYHQPYWPNNYVHHTIPPELSVLNEAERLFISPVKVMMKLDRLKGGGQFGSHGHSVLVINDGQTNISDVLPLNIDDVWLVYKPVVTSTHTFSSFAVKIRPRRIMSALWWLKQNNPLYRGCDVEVPDSSNPGFTRTVHIPEIKISDTWYRELQPHLTSYSIDAALNVHEYLAAMNKLCSLNDSDVGTEPVDGESVQPGTCLVDDMGVLTLNSNERLLGTSAVERLHTAIRMGDNQIHLNPDQRILVDWDCDTVPIHCLAFPVLYPYGETDYSQVKFKRLTRRYKEHLQFTLHMYDARFRESRYYILYCHNRMQRIKVGMVVGLASQRFYPLSVTSGATYQNFIKHINEKTPANKLDQLWGKAVRNLISHCVAFAGDYVNSVPYWIKQRHNISAMVAVCGPPHLYFTLSSADVHWPELYRFVIQRLHPEYTDSEIEIEVLKLSSSDCNAFLRDNAVMATQFFNARLHLFLQQIVLGGVHIFGKVIRYWFRIEFQQRGSPHVHGVLWLQDGINYAKEYTSGDVSNIRNFADINMVVTPSSMQSKYEFDILHEYAESVTERRYEDDSKPLHPSKLTSENASNLSVEFVQSLLKCEAAGRPIVLSDILNRTVYEDISGQYHHTAPTKCCILRCKNLALVGCSNNACMNSGHCRQSNNDIDSNEDFSNAKISEKCPIHANDLDRINKLDYQPLGVDPYVIRQLPPHKFVPLRNEADARVLLDIVRLFFKLQQHKCRTLLCKTYKGYCRFHFPKQQIDETTIKFLKSGVEILFKRKSGFEQYNQTHLLWAWLWRANTDIQIVSNMHAVVSYITNYISKSEGDLKSKKLINEAAELLYKHDTLGTLTLNSALRKILNTSQGARCVSIQEACYISQGLKMVECSHNFVLVNCWPRSHRSVRIQPNVNVPVVPTNDPYSDPLTTAPTTEYSAAADTIYSMINDNADRNNYYHRPALLADVPFLQFMSNCEVRVGVNCERKISSDLSASLMLGGDKVGMKQHRYLCTRKQAVIPVISPSIHSKTDDEFVCMVLLILLKPHYNEHDLLKVRTKTTQPSEGTYKTTKISKTKKQQQHTADAENGWTTVSSIEALRIWVAQMKTQNEHVKSGSSDKHDWQEELNWIERRTQLLTENAARIARVIENESGEFGEYTSIAQPDTYDYNNTIQAPVTVNTVDEDIADAVPIDNTHLVNTDLQFRKVKHGENFRVDPTVLDSAQKFMQTIRNEINVIKQADNRFTFRTVSQTTDYTTLDHRKFNEQQLVALRCMMHLLKITYDTDSDVRQPGAAMILTGEGGTGKSYLLQELRRILVYKYNEPASDLLQCTAFTGSAAHLVNGTTVASIFGLIPTDYTVTTSRSKDIYTALSKKKVLVIDEFSMISCQNLYWIDLCLKHVFGKQLPWGGFVVIFCGDPLQLSPVNGSSLAGKTTAHDGDIDHQAFDQGLVLWRSIKSVIALTKNMRCKDVEYVERLSRWRLGEVTEDDFNYFNECYVPDDSGIDSTSMGMHGLFSTYENKDIDAYNNKELRRLNYMTFNCWATHEFKVMSNVPINELELNRACHGLSFDDTMCPDTSTSSIQGKPQHRVPSMLRLAINSRVRLTHNLNISAGLVNGALGTVVGILYIPRTGRKDSSGMSAAQIVTDLTSDDVSYVVDNKINAPVVLVRFDKQYYSDKYPSFPSRILSPDLTRVVPITANRSFHQFQINNNGTIVVARRRQLPLQLVYGCTTYKIQGMSVDRIHGELPNRIPSTSKLTELTVVLLGRVTTKAGLTLRTKLIARHCMPSEIKLQENIRLVQCSLETTRQMMALDISEFTIQCANRTIDVTPIDSTAEHTMMIDTAPVTAVDILNDVALTEQISMVYEQSVVALPLSTQMTPPTTSRPRKSKPVRRTHAVNRTQFAPGDRARRQLFTTETRPIELPNVNQSCWFNALTQCLVSCPTFLDTLSSVQVIINGVVIPNKEACADANQYIVYSTQLFRLNRIKDLFSRITGTPDKYPTGSMLNEFRTHFATWANRFNTNLQQDPHEIFLTSIGINSDIRKLFTMEQTQIISNCTSCGNVPVPQITPQLYHPLSLVGSNFAGLLNNSMTSTIQYQCQTCQSNVDATQTFSIAGGSILVFYYSRMCNLEQPPPIEEQQLYDQQFAAYLVDSTLSCPVAPTHRTVYMYNNVSTSSPSPQLLIGGKQYELVARLRRSNTNGVTGAHYTAHVKRYVQGVQNVFRWWRCDDAKLEDITMENNEVLCETVHEHDYMLFYHRRQQFSHCENIGSTGASEQTLLLK